jgi:lipid-A-disaccharide synthase
MAQKIFVVAGEASGDLHAGELIRYLKKRAPETTFFGLGGRCMKEAGAELLEDMTALAVVGFIEILKNYSRFKKIFDATLAEVDARKPAAAILVDYPGFNLRLARELKKRGIKVIYFISPQVWAWGRERLRFIRQNVDLMLVLFRFEEILYKDGRFNVKFVGHPLLDIVRPTLTRDQMLEKIGFKKEFKTIALLPGSREREIKNLLPAMLEAGQKIYRRDPKTQFIVCRAGGMPRQIFKDIIEKIKIDFPYTVVDDDTYNGVNAADIAVVCSGTATLETAILNRPMVIVYKVSFLTWLLAKLCIKIPFIGLVNVVAGQKIVPELLQFDATPGKIAATAMNLLEDKKRLETIHAELYALKNTLGIPGALGRAAEEITKFLQTTNTKIQ